MSLVRNSIYSQTIDDLSLFTPEAGSSYIYCESSEKRSRHLDQWKNNAANIFFVEINTNIDDGSNSLTSFHAIIGTTSTEYLLRSEKSILGLIKQLSDKKIYLDITGLAHAIWARLLQIMVKNNLEVIVVYVEPYSFERSYSEGRVVYDLSERILGLNPLPGFFSFSSVGYDNVCFVPLLGFEGPRFQYLLEHVDPPGEKVYPVIGIPGFEPEYPFVTYYSNGRVLENSRSWQKVRFVPAYCPFSVFYLLKELHARHKDDVLKIAPIGTKPHSLGAVMYAILNEEKNNVELIYDNPVRKEGRSAGIARMHIYFVSKLTKCD
jgi:hypothetical protein